MRKVLLIFSELTDGDVEWLSKAGERIHVDAGATLVPLGARVDRDEVELGDGDFTGFEPRTTT